MSNYSIGLSGLNSNSAAIDTISNNIANASTVGYKAGEYIFQDQFYKAINPLDPARAGQGTAKQNIRRLMNMGTVQDSQNTLDMAITGSMGMFRLSDANDPDTVYYTRNGQFAVSKEVDPNFPKRSYIVNQNGMFLTGYSSQDGTTLGDSWTDKITMPPTELEPKTTTLSTIAVNLDARTNTYLPTGAVPFDPETPSTYNNKVTQTVYSADDNGGAHTMTLYYRRVDDQDMTVTYDGTNFYYPASAVAKNPQGASEINVVLTNDTSAGVDLITAAHRKTTSSDDYSAVTSFTVPNAGNVEQYARILRNGEDTGVGVTSAGTGAAGIATTTVAATGVPQVDTLTLSGAYQAGNVINVVVDDFEVNYTVLAANVPSGETTAQHQARIATAIAAAFNALTGETSTAAASGSTVTFTGNTSNDTFTSTTVVENIQTDADIDLANGDVVQFFNPATTATTSSVSSGSTVSISSNTAVEPGQFVFTIDSSSGSDVLTRVVDASGTPITVSSRTGTELTLSAQPSSALGSGDTLVFFNPVAYSLTMQDGSKVSMSGDLLTSASSSNTQEFTAVTTKYEVYASLDDQFYNALDNNFYSDIDFPAPIGDGVYNPIAEMQFWGGKNIDALVTNQVTGIPTFESQVTLTGKVTTPGNTAQNTDPDLIFTLDLTGTRNYATPFGVDQSTQDGRSVALLNSVTISDAGEVVGTYGDGRTFLAGQVALVNFAATDGLVPSGNNVFAASYLSGDEVHPNVTVGKPGAKGLGGIRAGAVEGSNVDLANELVKLLIQQRMYSANSQSIRAFDDTLTTTIRMAGG